MAGNQVVSGGKQTASSVLHLSSFQNISDVRLPPPRFATTILIVDAFREDREYWTQRLLVSAPNFVVLEADSGAAALAICQTQRVDCVILEMNLPDMAGFGLLIKLVPRARCPEIAVIMLSRFQFAPLAQLARANGAQGFLFKPLTSGDQLSMVVHKAIATVAVKRQEASV